MSITLPCQIACKISWNTALVVVLVLVCNQLLNWEGLQRFSEVLIIWGYLLNSLLREVMENGQYCIFAWQAHWKFLLDSKCACSKKNAVESTSHQIMITSCQKELKKSSKILSNDWNRPCNEDSEPHREQITLQIMLVGSIFVNPTS